MAKKPNLDQSVQRHENEYEKSRQLRVQENQKRIQDLGLKNIANSLTSLVESQKMKKKIMKSTHTNVLDDDYIPDVGDDSEEENEDVATSVRISKKQCRPQYIAPLSMNKIANLTKQHRVNAPKISQNLSLDSKATKENRASTTMGELISRNKRPQTQTGGFKQNLAKPNFTTRGSKKHMVLVDEDDDEQDDEIFKDINRVDMELDGLEDDENEGSIMRSQGEDMDHITFSNNENENQGDDRHDNIEGEDDRLVQDPLENATAISKTKKRGPSMLHVVHTRKADEREVIICNEFGQPVGPAREKKDVVGQFSRFLGTIARNYSYAPLIYSSWQKVPHKEKIWEYVQEKYDVPDGAKKWVLKSIGECYKVHKCRFKKKHFYQYKDNKTRWKNRPKSIPEDDFSQLLRLWNNKDVAKRCLRAKESRMSQKNMHTAGPKSFARIREELKNEDPNQELPTLTQMFERTRKRTEGRAYIDTYDDTAKKIEQMKNYKSVEDGSALIDPFLVVMNKENNGYRRLYGRGVTNTLIKKVDGANTSYMISGGFMESFKASVEVEKNQLLEMRKNIEEEQERKKAELEAMQKNIDNQRENLEAIMRKIMEQLPVGDREFVT